LKKRLLVSITLLSVFTLLLYSAFAVSKPLSSKTLSRQENYSQPAKTKNNSNTVKSRKTQPGHKKEAVVKNTTPASSLKTENRSAVNQRNSRQATGKQSTRIFFTVKLTINTGSNTYEYDVPIPEDSTVYDVLKAASKEEHFSLRATTYSYGVFIEEIHDVANNAQESTYWLYYVNGKLANVGCSSQQVKKGDDILWNYEKT